MVLPQMCLVQKLINFCNYPGKQVGRKREPHKAADKTPRDNDQQRAVLSLLNPAIIVSCRTLKRCN
jgi:hypothetical protein